MEAFLTAGKVVINVNSGHYGGEVSLVSRPPNTKVFIRDYSRLSNGEIKDVLHHAEQEYFEFEIEIE